MSVSAVTEALAHSNYSQTNYSQSIVAKRKDIAALEEEKIFGLKYNNVAKLQSKNLFNRYCECINTADQLDNFRVSNTSVQSTLTEQNSLVTGMQEKIISLRKMVMQYDLATMRVDLPSIATQNLREIALTLNSEVNGSFLLGGMTRDIPPIENIEAFVAVAASKDEGPNANYTKLVKDDKYSQVDFTSKIKISIDATDPAFQKIICALRNMKDLRPANLALKEQVIEMLDEAYTSFESMKVFIGSNDLILKDSQEKLARVEQSLQEDVNELFKADIPSLITQISERENELKIIFNAIGSNLKDNNLLLNYLR